MLIKTKNFLKQLKQSGNCDSKFIECYKDCYDLKFLENKIFYGTHCGYCIKVEGMDDGNFFTFDGIRGRCSGFMTVINGEIHMVEPLNNKQMIEELSYY